MDKMRVAIVSGADDANLEANINERIKSLEVDRDVDSIIDIKFASSTEVSAPVFGGLTGSKKLSAMIIYMLVDNPSH